MKRLLALIAVAGLAVGLYSATATGGQQAVTPAQFAALKKQVTQLQTKVTQLQKRATDLEDFANAIGICILEGRAAPVNTSTSWHNTGTGETPEFWALATTRAECANAINSPLAFKRHLGRIVH
jgi:hypothetical protein